MREKEDWERGFNARFDSELASCNPRGPIKEMARALTHIRLKIRGNAKDSV